jgi:hypothetical protein
LTLFFGGGGGGGAFVLFVPDANTGCVEGVETLVDTGAMAAVVDELVLAAQLVVEDGGLVLSHVVAVPVRPVGYQIEISDFHHAMGTLTQLL